MLKEKSVSVDATFSKKCEACQNVKRWDEFHIARENRDGLCAYCKDCKNYMNRVLNKRFREIMSKK